MELLDKLNLLAPKVAGMTDEEKQAALDFAASYRPTCLSAAKQDEAQIWYAAALLAAQQDAETRVPAGVTSETEGDLSRSYGDNGVSTEKVYMDRYQKLAALCGQFGSITVSHYDSQAH